MIFSPIHANPHEISLCAPMLQKALKGKFDEQVPSASCPVTAQLIDWLRLQNPGASFAQVTAFLRTHPAWPLKDRLQSKAEAALRGDENPEELISWFESNPPLTPNGAQFYAQALIDRGQEDKAAKVIGTAWRHLDFDEQGLKDFYKKFRSYLSQEDHCHRMDNLLMKENIADVQHMYPWLTEPHQRLADARIALIAEAGDVDTKLAGVPSHLRHDPGLVYDRLKWYRRKNLDSRMLKLFLHAPPHPGHEDLWWRERNLLVRRLMDAHSYGQAYELVREHGLSSGENFANAEWLAGWLALRLLKEPAAALKHFKTLREQVKSPISVSRAAYWGARAYEALGKEQKARAWMAEARTFPGTYYGQIALRGGVSGQTPLLQSKRPRIDKALRQTFDQREFVQVIRLLCAVKAKNLIEPFGFKLCQELTDLGEQVLAIEMAAKECGAYYGVLAAKKLPVKNVPLIEGAYPLLPGTYNAELKRTNAALVHAIIRQESRFKADAISPAGAQGLMQLMPKTALHTAQKIRNFSGNSHKPPKPLEKKSKLTKSEKKSRLVKKGRLGGSALGKTSGGSLADPAVNIPLGCAHLRDLLDKYKGSLILSIAAYNAGGKAVDKWLEEYGDPRDPAIDLVDWIEKIPFAETRNYVQRVLENYAWYAQRLGK